MQRNAAGIVPTLMGSLGLGFVSQVDWEPEDIDIHVQGDPRGWNAPDELRIYGWEKIMLIMSESGYVLTDVHEHEFRKRDVRVEFGSISSLYDFTGIREVDIGFAASDEAIFRVPDLKQFLDIYHASSKDSYRNDKNNKDFVKIDWIERHLQIDP